MTDGDRWKWFGKFFLNLHQCWCRPEEYPGGLFQITWGVELVHSLQACLSDIKVPDVAGSY